MQQLSKQQRLGESRPIENQEDLHRQSLLIRGQSSNSPPRSENVHSGENPELPIPPVDDSSDFFSGHALNPPLLLQVKNRSAATTEAIRTRVSETSPPEPERSSVVQVEPPKPPPPVPFNPRIPLMSYTRLFDGADADLVATLRDYLEFRSDERSGGWEGYLQRSDDFMQFTAHLMIFEMLTLHGGDARRRIVFKLRKHK